MFSDVIVEPLRGRQVAESIQDIHREFTSAVAVLVLRHLFDNRINFVIEQTEDILLVQGCNIIQLPEHLGGSVIKVAVVTFAFAHYYSLLRVISVTCLYLLRQDVHPISQV